MSMPDLRLHLVRTQAGEHATLGQLFIDGQYKWFCLEDRWRPNEIKIPGETCIPAGTYQVIINRSVRFGKMLPLLLNVPGFEGVRIHPGNTDKDTAGCILVGGSCQPNALPVPRIGDSAVACADVQQKIAMALAAGNKVWIEIIDPGTGTGVEVPTEGEAKPAGVATGKITIH